MEETLLPKETLSIASISLGGEHAWRKEDVPHVIEAAREAMLVNLGGQPQFQGPIGTAEPYWLDFGPTDRKENESWQNYVERSAKETLASFNHICESTDFNEVGCENWPHIAEAKAKGLNPSDHLWFVLYFEQNK